MSCWLCGAPVGEPFLVRRGVPVHQNQLVASEAEALAVLSGDLELTACERCGFVFNAAFRADKLSYDAQYENTQSHSNVFDEYLNDLIRHLVDERGVRDARIVEVGCGKGVFLKKLVHAHEGNRGIGFDPSYIGPLSDGKIEFRRQFFAPGVETGTIDVVVSRHVIEHVAEPVAFLRSVREAIGDATARIFFETPCFDWILGNRVFWDIFYEHCNYFTRDSLSAAFAAAGFEVREVRKLFGDQYLWLEAAPARERRAPTGGRLPAVRQFAARAVELEREWASRLERHSARGPVALWGAGAKGVTFANLLDCARVRVRCVVDINPNKQGRFLPGSAHPIVPPERLRELGVKTVILMNSNYRAEVAAQLNELGFDIALEEAEVS